MVELYLSDEFFGGCHAQVGLVLGVIALHYLHEADDDVSAVVGLSSDQTVQVGCGCGHVSLGAVFVLWVDSSEGSLDIVSSEVAFAIFESESGEYSGRCYLVCSGVVFGGETEEARGVLYLHEGTLEIADYVSSVVGFLEDDLFELLVRFSGCSGHRGQL